MAETKKTAAQLYEEANAAAQSLKQLQAQQPAAYQSAYGAQIDALAQQIARRPSFTYDANGDLLYRQYSARYQKQGRTAMEDTLGQAAGMTGGYGNSYAATASNQAYQAYLSKLNDVLPTLYETAYGKYRDAGETMQKQLENLQGMESNAYSAYRDQAADYAGNVTAAQNYWKYLNDAAYKAQQDEQAQSNWQMNWDAAHPTNTGGSSSGSSKKKKNDVVKIAQKVSAAVSKAATPSKNTMTRLTR